MRFPLRRVYSLRALLKRKAIRGFDVRSGTRIPCNIPITLTSLNATQWFSEPGVVILANPQGCAVRCRRPVEVGTAVLLDGLPRAKMAATRVVNSIQLGRFRNERPRKVQREWYTFLGFLRVGADSIVSQFRISAELPWSLVPKIGTPFRCTMVTEH